ncbi:glutaminyl-peptide cyclotransferase [Salinifilum aidingensis]
MRSALVRTMLLACCLLPAACTTHVPPQDDSHREDEQTDQGVRHTQSVPRLRAEVTATLPHDRSSFTQGLELHDGTLYESTGTYGGSALRALDPATGRVRSERRLPADLFGEGMTVVDDRIWQLTWQEEVALVRSADTLDELRRVPYDGEGWGLCSDGRRLISSDGSAQLDFHDPATYEPRGSVRVHLDGRAVTQINELECVGDQVWANLWHSDHLVRIDPGTGAVTAVVDATGLLTRAERARADVLNGIAKVPGTDEYLLTGKNWPHLFRVRFVPE